MELYEKNIIPNEAFDPTTFFTKKELCYYKMIDKFFHNCHESKIIKMLSIIEGKSEISLRILDWFVTKYAKKGIDFVRDGDTFDVHINYKAQLKSYKKRYFDPFRRKRKFDYKYNINGEIKTLYTTIGQLNFFRWAISNDILNFVEKYLPQITKAMNLSNKEEKKNKLKKSDENLSSSESGNSKNDNKGDNKNNSKGDVKININTKKSINVNAIKNINNDEIELILHFD